MRNSPTPAGPSARRSRSAPTNSSGQWSKRSATNLDELLERLDAWSDAIVASGAYPQQVAGIYNIGGGPHFGSGLSIDTAAELFANKA